MTLYQRVVRNLAAAFLSGTWTRAELAARGAQAMGRRERWLSSLARRVLATYPNPPARDAEVALVSFIAADAYFQKHWKKLAGDSGHAGRRYFWVTPKMSPGSETAASWQVPG